MGAAEMKTLHLMSAKGHFGSWADKQSPANVYYPTDIKDAISEPKRAGEQVFRMLFKAEAAASVCYLPHSQLLHNKELDLNTLKSPTEQQCPHVCLVSVPPLTALNDVGSEWGKQRSSKKNQS